MIDILLATHAHNTMAFIAQAGLLKWQGLVMKENEIPVSITEVLIVVRLFPLNTQQINYVVEVTGRARMEI